MHQNPQVILSLLFYQVSHEGRIYSLPKLQKSRRVTVSRSVCLSLKDLPSILFNESFVSFASMTNRSSLIVLNYTEHILTRQNATYFLSYTYTIEYISAILYILRQPRYFKRVYYFFSALMLFHFVFKYSDSRHTVIFWFSVSAVRGGC